MILVCFNPKPTPVRTSAPDRTTASAKEENNNKDDEKCLGIHDFRPFQSLDVVPTSFEATYSLLPHHRIAVGDRLGIYSTTN